MADNIVRRSVLAKLASKLFGVPEPEVTEEQIKQYIVASRAVHLRLQELQGRKCSKTK